MREAWVNLYFVDKASVTQTTGGISMIGGIGLNLPPGEKTTATFSAPIESDGRIIQLSGVRYRWTSRFAVWLNDTLVYDSRDWEAAVTFNYDTLTTNPQIDAAGMHDGAVSGPLIFKPGDTLTYSCFIDNTTDKTLTFTQDLQDGGEMCILLGSTIGGSISN